jgi:hypothetical protein
MTTSGSRDFNLDVAEVIEEAYERCGLEVRTGYDAKTARRSLNLMFADWANRGLNLWTVAQATTTLTQGTSTYTLGADVIDILEMVLRRDDTDFEVERISRGDYLNFPNKTDQGRPSQFYLDRKIQPVITLWQTPENSTDQFWSTTTCSVSKMRTPCRIQRIFRSAFLPCMVAGLAYYLAMKRAPERLQILKAVYEEEFQRAAEEDEDRVALKLQPSARYMRT